MTVEFLTDPTLERAPRGRYRLVTPLAVRVNGAAFVVPVGFTFDGASVPPLFWPLISHPMAPSSLRAACLHDFGCSTRYADSRTIHATFHAALLADGCAPLRAWLMGWAVRVFGPRFTVAQ
jgi:hypothetical protein